LLNFLYELYYDARVHEHQVYVAHPSERFTQQPIRKQNNDLSGRASEAWVCGCSLAGFAGSHLTKGIEVCLLEMLCAFK